MDYSSTINLPKTDFSMKANLNEREPLFVKEWEASSLYRLLREKKKEKQKFILHDGPPYANGHIHLGHSLNKILKDIIVKYNNMLGRNASYVPGWDCHGLPIELQVVKTHHGQPLEKDALRKECREYARKFIEVQKDEFKRLGILGDWENPYTTMSEDYEKAIVDSFGRLVEKGYVYRALKPVYWCPSCETALADAEVEYQNHQTPSLYVKFGLKPNRIFKEKAFWLIWTTTPWTLPANVAICLNPDEEYMAARTAQDEWRLFASKLKNTLKDKLGFEILEERKLQKSDLGSLTAVHPFLERDSRIVFDRYVTMDTGTGCVHIAPGHGYEDYVIGLKEKLPVLSPVDSRGRFTQEVGISEWAGENVFKANDRIMETLKATNHLILVDKLEHQYPHCWRCKKPVIFRATWQWFLNVEKDGLREKCLDSIKKVKWIPEWGIERIGNMLKERPDWCLSRQRAWGVPIPAFFCEECGEVAMTSETIGFFSKMVEKQGVDIWFTMPAEKLLPDGFKCLKCGAQKFKKEQDILDVWFDSGVSHIAVLENPRWKDLSSPADLYLEGSDQHRGWFQSSLIPSVALKGVP
ncbi:MAG: isoleucine--tRNA ligase, partial [bacterium]|nr:isoleucine--tRNA ligase [bacterium]